MYLLSFFFFFFPQADMHVSKYVLEGAEPAERRAK